MPAPGDDPSSDALSKARAADDVPGRVKPLRIFSQPNAHKVARLDAGSLNPLARQANCSSPFPVGAATSAEPPRSDTLPGLSPAFGYPDTATPTLQGTAAVPPTTCSTSSRPRRVRHRPAHDVFDIVPPTTCSTSSRARRKTSPRTRKRLPAAPPSRPTPAPIPWPTAFRQLAPPSFTTTLDQDQEDFTPDSPPTAPFPFLEAPNDLLRTVLDRADPATRLTCRRFHQTHSPPTHLTPCPTPILSTPEDILPALLSLPSLPHIRTLDLSCLPTSTRSTLLEALAPACPSLTGITHSGGLLTRKELAALVTHRGPALLHLHGVSIRSPACSRQGATGRNPLPRCTALQTLHIQRVQSATSLQAAAIGSLTCLRRLSFHPKACLTCQAGPQGMAVNAAEVLEAAGQLPHLDTLELPTWGVVWDATAAALLGSMTRLTALQVGTCNVPGTLGSCGASMVASVAALPDLRRLMAVDPGWWVPASSQSALGALTRLEALAVVLLTQEVEGGAAGAGGGGAVASVLGGVDTVLGGCVGAPITELVVDAQAVKVPVEMVGLEQLLAQHSSSTLALKFIQLPLAGLGQLLARLPQLQRLDWYCLPSAAELRSMDDGPALASVFAELGALTALTSLTFRAWVSTQRLPNELTRLTGLRELHLPH